MSADIAPAEQPLPVSVLTGFLGSGKTTVLRHLLCQPGMTKIAVIINEFGEIGIDHILVESTDESLVLLKNGCLCCTVRSDLVRALRSLYVRRTAGEIPDFDRVIVETTGLADPASIVHCLLRDALLADCYRLDGVVTTVDAVMGRLTLDRHTEAVKQAALADRLLLTKTDLAAAPQIGALTARLRAINPSAPILCVVQGEVSAEVLLNVGYYNPSTKSVEVRRWLDAEAYSGQGRHADDETEEAQHVDARDGHAAATHDRNRHDDHIRAFCLTYDAPVEWQTFAAAMEALIEAHGSSILRVKGLLNVVGRETPLVIHGVQHLFHPPVLLDSWPDTDRRSRLVFITRDMEQDFVARRLAPLWAPSATMDGASDVRPIQ
jgi:G3E family GTPase